MSERKKNSRRAAMDAERLHWKVFRMLDDGRQWKQRAVKRRAFLVTAANSANQDGSHVEIAVTTFTKAGGERRSAFQCLKDLAEMGVLLSDLHIDERGVEREQLSKYGTKIRALHFEKLQAAQRSLDAGQPFAGHPRLTEEQQREIQRGPLRKGVQNSVEGVQNSLEKECGTQCEGVQNSSQGVQNSCKGVQSKAAQNRPCPTEVSPTDQPSDPAGLGGRTVGNSQATGKNTTDKEIAKPAVSLSDRVFRILNGVHRECAKSSDPIEGFPIALTRSGLNDLTMAFRGYDYFDDGTADDNLSLLAAAYYAWFRERLRPSWLGADGKTNPIRVPLAMFAREVVNELDDANEVLHTHQKYHDDNVPPMGACFFCELCDMAVSKLLDEAA